MKFVIHFHQDHHSEEDHYDFMVEPVDTTELLFTWRIKKSDMPLLQSGSIITAFKIQDHRKKYLSYEGPISCDRGRVEIFDSGKYETVQWEKDAIHITLIGKVLQGKIKLHKETSHHSEEKPESWEMRFQIKSPPY